jgi:sirohydrochlorin cobaltochelatase
MPSALLLFGHGSRDPRWSAPFEAVRDAVARSLSDSTVRLAYLEHSPPDLDAAVAALAAEGHREVDLVPLFLGAGGHVRRDIPEQAEAASARHGVAVRVRPFVGEAPAVIEAIARHVAAAVADGSAG